MHIINYLYFCQALEGISSTRVNSKSPLERLQCCPSQSHCVIICLHVLCFCGQEAVVLVTKVYLFVFRRISDEKAFPLDGKRQRFHSPHQEPTIINQLVPLSGDRRYSMPPLFHTHYVPDIVRCVPPLREIPLLEPREITLPEAKDKVVLIQFFFLFCLLKYYIKSVLKGSGISNFPHLFSF